MGYFKISQKQDITIPQKADCVAVRTMLENYAIGIEWNITVSDRETQIKIGDGVALDCGENEYAINVTENGVFINGRDYKSLMSGFFGLLEMIFCYGKRDYRIDCTEVKTSGKIGMRALHICLFPEVQYEVIKKTIRAAAVCKYTHIFLETWGNIKLDTLKELAWRDAFSKAQIKELVNEANALGMEVIPFFQHLGHASLSRLGYSGKHVVLDQNPELEYLYYPRSYGWVWNFKLPEVRKLLKDVRSELIELFGEGSYFHLGCDESGMEFSSDELSEYLNEVTEDLKKQGRRPIIWGDMLLSKDFFKEEEEDPRRPGMIRYECNSSYEYATELIEKLSKDIIIADWEYNVESAPWKSSVLLSQKGFDVICCPWQYTDNMISAIQTADTQKLMGVMETTWDSLLKNRGAQKIFFVGMSAFGDEKFKNWTNTEADRMCSIFRRVSQKGQEYKDCGWSEKQVEM